MNKQGTGCSGADLRPNTNLKKTNTPQQGLEDGAGLGRTCTVLALALMLAASQASPASPGAINIVPDQVRVGQVLQINLQSPPDIPFIQQVRIFKDPNPQDVSSNNWPLARMTGGVSITDEQNAVQPGQPFSLAVDTFYYTPGAYYFQTFAVGMTAIYDSVQVLAREDWPLSFTREGVYAENGQFLAGPGADEPLAALSPSAPGVLVLELNQWRGLRNTVHVDFDSPDGSRLEKADLLQIKIIPDRAFTDTLSLEDDVAGIRLDRGSFAQGLARAYFRAPAHQKYYENAGRLRFRFSGVPLANTNSQFSEFSFSIRFEDSPAQAPIPDFATCNEQTYPGQAWRNDYPLDVRHVRLVRIGNVRLMEDQELQAVAAQLAHYFSLASKGYFRLAVDGIHRFPLANPQNQEKVIQWYQSAPKTPEKSLLDLGDANQLYLAAMLYYYEHLLSEFEQDIKKIYAPGANNEDLTIYLFDGPGDLGQAMGANGIRIKITRLYPIYVFYQGTGTNRTYHSDLGACAFCGNTIADYLAFLQNEGSTIQTLNTTIHELGHAFWLKNLGLNAADLSTINLPFNSDIKMLDDSVSFFRRSEYMSYARNRDTLEGLTFGDIFLERLLAAYPTPLDWDRDGLPDEWEMQYFGAVTGADPLSDQDQDGFSNLQEYTAGTNPTNSTSRFAIQTISRQGDTTTVAFDSALGRIYTLEFSNDLAVDSQWSNVVSQVNVPGTGALISMSDSGSFDRRYYRLRVGLGPR
jgi:hypothetical protein